MAAPRLTMATPWLAESGSRRLSGSLSRGVSDSQLAESGSRRLSDSPSFYFKHSKADAPTRRVGESSTRRVGESATPRLAESESRRLADLPSRGAVFRLRISPRIQSQKRNGSKDNVRYLWGPNFCKNRRKSASLPCPFKSESFP